jgi:hypothetical protein
MRANASERQSTIYVIGGLPRTGKTTLANRLTDTLAIGGMETDHIRILFEPTPTSKIRYGSDAPIETVTQKLRPRLQCLIKALVDQSTSFVLNGECIDPHMVASSPYRDRLKSCFFGLDDPQAAMNRIREIDDPNDWASRKPDSELVPILEKYAVRSEALRQTAAELDLAYIDASQDFLQAHTLAFRLLSESETAPVTAIAR